MTLITDLLPAKLLLTLLFDTTGAPGAGKASLVHSRHLCWRWGHFLASLPAHLSELTPDFAPVED